MNSQVKYVIFDTDAGAYAVTATKTSTDIKDAALYSSVLGASRDMMYTDREEIHTVYVSKNGTYIDLIDLDYEKEKTNE